MATVIEAHLGGALHSEVPEPAQAEHRHQVAGTGRAAPERVEHGDACAAHRGGFRRAECLGDARQGEGGHHDHLGIPARIGQTGDL
jgi:hypothetical protein